MPEEKNISTFLTRSSINRKLFEKEFSIVANDCRKLAKCCTDLRKSGNYEGLARIAMLCFANTKNKEAKVLWQEAFQSNQVSWYQHLRYAELLFDEEGFESASKYIREIYIQHPEAKNGFASIAWKIRKENPSFSMKLFEKDALSGHLSAGFRLNYAEFLATEGQVEKAEKEVEQGYKESASLKDGYARIGGQFLPSGKEKALPYFTEDSDLNRLSPSFQVTRAILSAELGMLNEAEKAIESAYSASADIKDGYAQIGWSFFYKRNQYDKLLVYFLNDDKFGRLSAAWTIKKAFILGKTGKLEVAESLIEEAYSKDKKLTDAFCRLAWECFYYKKQFPRMLPYFERDCRNKRISPKWQLSYAVVLSGMGKMDEASLKVTEAYSKDPSLKDGYINSAWSILRDKKNWDNLLEIGLNEERNGRLSLSGKLKLAQAKAGNGSMEDAKAEIEQIYSIDQNSKGLYSGLAMIVKESSSDYKKALDLILKDFKEGRGTSKEVILYATTLAEFKFHDKTGDLEYNLSDPILKTFNSCFQKADKAGQALLSCIYHLRNNSFHHALLCIERVWLISDFSHQYLQLYTSVCLCAEQIEKARNALRSAGIHSLEKGNIGQALRTFFQSHSFYNTYLGKSKFEYDFEMIKSIRSYAERLRSDQIQKPGKKTINVVILLCSIDESGAVPRIMSPFFVRSKCKTVQFYFALSKPLHVTDKNSNSHYKKISELELKTVGAFFHYGNIGEALLETFEDLNRLSPDVIVTSSQGPNEIFLCSACPNAKTANLVFGDLPNFALPDTDLCIYSYPGFDNKIPWLRKRIQYNRNAVSSDIYDKLRDISLQDTYNILPDNLVFCSAGRPQKYRNPKFWELISCYIKKNRKTSFILIGCEKNDHIINDYINRILPSELCSNVVLVPRHNEYLNIVNQADIYIDSFPEGGGFTVCDAIMLNKPVVVFSHNNSEESRYYELSVYNEIASSECIIPRSDSAAFEQLINTYQTNVSFRNRVCRENLTSVKTILSNKNDMLSELADIICTNLI